jgi:hypothetical protein
MTMSLFDGMDKISFARCSGTKGHCHVEEWGTQRNRRLRSAQAAAAGPGPAGAGHGEGDLGQASVCFAVPGKPVSEHHDLLQVATEGTLFALLDDEQRIGAKLTESFAMWLGASV